MRAIRSLPREVIYFAGIGAYGFGIGIVYWFLTYETAGSILLVVFGGGAILFASFLAFSVRARDRAPTGEPLPVEPDVEGPFGGPAGRVPAGSLAPLEMGFGLAVGALSLVFGVWMLLAAIVPLGAGAISWLRSSERELLATRRDDAADVAADDAAGIAPEESDAAPDAVSPSRQADSPRSA